MNKEQLVLLIASIDQYRRFKDTEFDPFQVWLSTILTLATQLGCDPMMAGQLLEKAKSWDQKITFFEYLKGSIA